MLKAKILFAFLYREEFEDTVTPYAFCYKRIISTDGVLPNDTIVIKKVSFDEYLKYQTTLNSEG